MSILPRYKRKDAFRTVMVFICMLGVMTCSIGCRKKAATEHTPTFQEQYIDGFRRIGARSGRLPYQYGAEVDTIATQMGLDYKDKNMPLMHVVLFGDEYIYDEYLKVYLYLYSKNSDNGETYDIDDLLEEYQNESREIMDQLMVFHEKGGDNKTYHYLIEISKVYAQYKEQTGEQVEGKELRDLKLEEYILLEDWAMTHVSQEECPTIFQANGK